MSKKRITGIVLLLLTQTGLCMAQGDVNEYLRNATYDEGIKVFTAKTESAPGQADLFALATLQFINGVEDLVQGLYRFGFKSDSADVLSYVMPLIVIPIPKNTKAQPVQPKDIEQLISTWYGTLEQTDKTLQRLSREDFKVRLNLGEAMLDINGDGQTEESENLFLSCSRWFGNGRLGDASAFYLNCDGADALWLRGYCHLLMGLLDVLQAHDWRTFYAKTAHVLFESPDKAMMVSSVVRQDGEFFADIIDIVLLIHEFHLEAVHPEGYRQARDHFTQVIRLSRAFWEAVDKETDDDHEWVPNARQTAASGARVTPEMINGWKTLLDELELILTGRKLIPHFRVQKDYGINLAKLIDNPPALDIVELWSGLGLAPYVEKGEFTDPDLWRRAMATFSGAFMRTAVWFN